MDRVVIVPRYQHDLCENVRRFLKAHAGFDFPGDSSVCYNCRKPTKTPLRCSVCKDTIYCSKSCQKAQWNAKPAEGNGAIGDNGHKYQCAALKEFMKESPEFMSVFFQFPWAILEPDGKFLLWFALALRDMYEGDGSGWWAQGIGYSPKDIGHAGRSLLLDEHLTDVTGWNILSDEIPFLSFQEGKMPKYHPIFEHNWSSYYRWRGLPLKSPAALLLHWPLSVYRLLFLMGFVPHDVPESRKRLVLYYIGVQQELDCIPVFGELALLLPNTDIELIMFGQRAYQLTTLAKPPALASKEYVFEYSAPAACGAGSIRIRLDRTGPYWDPASLLISYHRQWDPVVVISRALAIPFGVTEFNRGCLADDDANYPVILRSAVEVAHIDKVVGCCKARAMLESVHQPCAKALNPFMKPRAYRSLTGHLPTGVNGFTCIVTPRNSGQVVSGCSCARD